AWTVGVSTAAKKPAEEKRFFELCAPMPASVFSSISVPRRRTLSERPKLAKARLKPTDAPPTRVTSTALAPVCLILARLESKLSTAKGRYSSPTIVPWLAAIYPLAALLVSRGQL